MRPPIFNDVNGRRFWQDGIRYRVEYALWSLGVARVRDITAAVNTGHCRCVTPGEVSASLKALLETPKVEKLGHGVYRHGDSPFT